MAHEAQLNVLLTLFPYFDAFYDPFYEQRHGNIETIVKFLYEIIHIWYKKEQKNMISDFIYESVLQ